MQATDIAFSCDKFDRALQLYEAVDWAGQVELTLSISELSLSGRCISF